MKKIHIVTDSTADLHPKYLKDNKVTVAPLTVTFQEQSYLDGIDLSPDEFFVKLADSDKLPTTSQVTVGSFVNIYKELAKEYDTVISIHISSKMSGTYQSAVLAAEEVPELEIIPIDSRTVTSPLGQLVLNAIELVEEGASVEEILMKLKQARESQEIYFAAGTLEYLAKGGRIGKAQSLVGSILNIKPILIIDQEGFIAPFEKIRGSKKVLVRMEELIKAYLAKYGPSSRVTIMHSANYKTADAFNELLRDKYGITEVDVSSVGPVVGTHIGPGAIGFAVTARY